MNFKERAREEAVEYAKGYDFEESQLIAESAYLAGVGKGYRLAVEYLRSEEAENKPRKAGTQFEFEKTWDNGDGWADWLLEKAGME